jgi:hypothetical protein
MIKISNSHNGKISVAVQDCATIIPFDEFAKLVAKVFVRMTPAERQIIAKAIDANDEILF